jgi:hypothetical protein
MTPWEDTPSGPTLFFRNSFRIKLTPKGDLDRFRNLGTATIEEKTRTIVISEGSVIHDDDYMHFNTEGGGKTFIRKEFVASITDNENHTCWPRKVE